MAMVLLVPILVSLVALSSSINLPPVYGTGQQICNYQYAIPRSGNCATYGPSLEQHLDVVQQDMDRIKLQYVSQNTVLQEEIRKLRQQTSATEATVADLTKDLKDLTSTVFNLQTKVATPSYIPNPNTNPGPSSQTSAMLQQLVTTTRAQLTQQMLQLQNGLNAALASLRTDRQRDAIEQSKVDVAFQAQLRQQQQDLTSVLQELQMLQNRVNTMALSTGIPPTGPRQTNPPKPPTSPATPIFTLFAQTTQSTSQPSTQPPAATNAQPVVVTTTSSGPTTPDPTLMKLQADVQQLDSRMKQMEQDVQKDLPDLKQIVQNMQELSKNQTMQVSDVYQESEFILNTELPDMKADISKNYGAIAQLSEQIRNNLNPLQQEVQKIAQNVTELNKQITIIGTDFFTQKVQLNTDETRIDDLATMVNLQASKLSRLIQQQHFTTPVPPVTTPPTTTPFPFVPTPKPTNNNQG